MSKPLLGRISIGAISFFYVFAGVGHFLYPESYVVQMPSYFPEPKLLVLLSGAAEVVLGLAMQFKKYRRQASYAIIIMLLVFLPVHFYWIELEGKIPGYDYVVPMGALYGRIAFQFVLMYWAFRAGRVKVNNLFSK